MQRVAIIGATGLVGRTMIQELVSSNLYKNSESLHVGLFASSRSEGKKLWVGEEEVVVQGFSPEKLRGYDVALMSAGGGFSKDFSPQLAKQGTVVIDNSSAWRQHKEVPLVVPEVNAHALDKVVTHSSWDRGAIIANPNCSTIQMMVSLAPLEKKFGIQKIITSTYQSVSGSGASGLAELEKQRQEISSGQIPSCEFYPEPIVGNVLACIGDISREGHSWEELKMMLESQKIFSRRDLQVMATAVRVPVMYGHGQMVACELKCEVTREEVYRALEEASGLVVMRDGDGNFPVSTPLQVKGKKDTYVSRVRLGSEEASSSWVQMWNVADNVTKGAATNAIQILEALHNSLTHKRD